MFELRSSDKSYFLIRVNISPVIVLMYVSSFVMSGGGGVI